MVSASRMRRAQTRVAEARPYAEHIRGIVADISGRSGASSHPLMEQRDVQNVAIVTLTPDRGLAGALVTNINRETMHLIKRVQQPVRVVAVGRKGAGFAARARLNLVGQFTGLGDRPTIADIAPIARQVLDDYESGAVDTVYLVYAQFISTLRQQAKSVQLLPVQPPEESESTGPWSYEPDNPQAVLSQLLPAYVEFIIYQAMLEAIASEHSARMIAMSSATDNALELIDEYTLLANKARQAEVTKEISEISGAAEALRTG